MTKRPRRNRSPALITKVALAAIKGQMIKTEMAQKFDLHTNQITQWKTQMLEQAACSGRVIPDLVLSDFSALPEDKVMDHDFWTAL